jgi:UDP-2,4-diacetamido-2,4,6-trideoxy-beta-L-altropyranose hydrolase
MAIVFRVDASAQIGTGHVMRCITLATALKKNGHEIVFVARQLTTELSTKIIESNFQLSLLDYTFSDDFDELPHAHWLKCSQSTDANATIQIISKLNVEWVIVDHYGIDYRWHSKIKLHTDKIMVIDDIADRVHDCDMLLDQNFYINMQTRYIGKVPLNCEMLLGPEFLILRDEFILKREQAKLRTTSVKNILVNFGGVDPDNYTKTTLEILAKVTDYEYEVNVVIGTQHPAKDDIKDYCKKNGFNCYIQTNQMSVLILKADMAIGAGGATTWERCALGLPTIVLPIADNQLELVIDAATVGILYYADIDLKSKNNQNFECHIRALLSNSILRSSISKRAMELIGTSGTNKIVHKLSIRENTGELYIREAIFTDANITWSWRNNKLTRQYFFNDIEIKIDDHIKWWCESLDSKERKLLLGFLSGIPIGVVRFDFENTCSANISIYLNPDLTGKGLGKRLMLEAEKWFSAKFNLVTKLTAEVKIENQISERMFIACGFKRDYIVFKKVISHD